MTAWARKEAERLAVQWIQKTQKGPVVFSHHITRLADFVEPFLTQAFAAGREEGIEASAKVADVHAESLGNCCLTGTCNEFVAGEIRQLKEKR